MIIRFGDNLKYLRKTRKLKQTDIAQIVGKSVPTISAWEKGTRSPLVEDVFVLSRFFNVDMEQLYFSDIRAEALSGK